VSSLRHSGENVSDAAPFDATADRFVFADAPRGTGDIPGVEVRALRDAAEDAPDVAAVDATAGRCFHADMMATCRWTGCLISETYGL